jgi:hypothetical protein
MCDPFGTKKAASRAAEVAATGARQAADAQYGLTEQGITKAENYLAPLVGAGTEGTNLLRQILGLEGQAGQQQALGMYQSSPEANLLARARVEAVRSGQGQFASRGMLRSGALTEDLANRLSQYDVEGFRNYENTAKGLTNLGASAAGQGANIVNQGFGNLGAIRGSGIAGAANATAQGITNKANANANLWGGGLNLLSNVAGFGMGNDWFGNKG